MPVSNVAHRREGLVDVLRVDRAGQAVGHRVGHPDPLLERARSARPWSPGRRSPRTRRASSRRRRRRPSARRTSPCASAPVGELLAAGQRASRPPPCRSRRTSRPSRAASPRRTAPCRRSPRGRCRPAAPSTRRDQLLDELVVDALVHEQPRGGRAALAGRAERAPDRAVDRQVDVRVVHDEDRVLAAHLQVQALERRRAGLRDAPPDLGRAGEGDDLDVRMLRPADRRPRRPSP